MSRRLRRDRNKRVTTTGYERHVGDLEITGQILGPAFTNIVTAVGILGARSTTPVDLAITDINGAYKGIILKWDIQYNLSTFDHYELQISDNDINWYSLKIDGTGYLGTENAWTSVVAPLFVHFPIPHGGTEDTPVGITAYYRLRQATKDGTKSNWSASVSATTSLVETGDLAANAITANKILAGNVQTSHLEALAVTTAKIALLNITPELMSSDIVTDYFTDIGQAPPDENLVGYWSLNDTTDDFSGNGNHGVLNPGAGSWETGMVGRCFDFAGDGAVTLNDVGLDLATTGSISLWFTCDASTGTLQVLVDRNSYGYALFINTGGTSFGIRWGTHSYNSGTIPAVFGTGWHHVVLSRDGTDSVLYYDGVVNDTRAGTEDATVSNTTYFASRATTSLFLDGAMDEVRIYNKGLSQAEVTFLHRNPSGVQPTAPMPKYPGNEDLVLYLPLDGYEGTHIVDASGTREDITLTPGSGAWEPGKVGNCYHFNDDIIESETTGASLVSTDYTILFWIYIDNTPSGTEYVLVKSDSTGANIDELIAFGASSTKIVWLKYNSTPAAKTLNGPTLEVATWYHCAFVFNNTSGKRLIYLNGRMYSEQTDSETWRNSGDRLALGAILSGTAEFDGKLDEVQIYEKELTPEEVLFFYLNPGGSAKGQISRNDVAWGEIDSRHLAFGAGLAHVLNDQVFTEDDGELFPLGLSLLSSEGRPPIKQLIVPEPAIIRDSDGDEYWNPRAKEWGGLVDDPRTDTLGIYQETENLAEDPENLEEWTDTGGVSSLTDEYIDGKRLSKITVSGASTCYAYRAYTFTAAVHSFQCIFKKGNAAASTDDSRLYIVDSGSNSYYLNVDWGTGVVSGGNGAVVVDEDWIGDDIVRVTGYTPALVAGAGTIRVYPNVGETANDYVYVTAVQVELLAYPTPYTPSSRPAGALQYRKRYYSSGVYGTISLWVRPRFTYNDGQNHYVWHQACPNGHMAVYYDGSTSKWTFEIYVDASNYYRLTSAAVASNSALWDWHHLKFRNYLTSVDFAYLNGSVVSSSASAGSPVLEAPTSGIELGAKDIAEQFDGELIDMGWQSLSDTSTTHYDADRPWKDPYSVANYNQSLSISRKKVEMLRGNIAGIDKFNRRYAFGDEGLSMWDRAGNPIHRVASSPILAGQYYGGHLHLLPESSAYELENTAVVTKGSWITTPTTPFNEGNDVNAIIIQVYFVTTTTGYVFFRPKGSAWAGTAVNATTVIHKASYGSSQITVPVSDDYELEYLANGVISNLIITQKGTFI